MIRKSEKMILEPTRRRPPVPRGRGEREKGKEGWDTERKRVRVVCGDGERERGGKRVRSTRKAAPLCERDLTHYCRASVQVKKTSTLPRI